MPTRSQMHILHPHRLIRKLWHLWGASLSGRIVFLILAMLAIVYSANLVFIGKLWQSTEASIAHERQITAKTLAAHASHALGSVDHLLDTMASEIVETGKLDAPAMKAGRILHSQPLPQLADFGIVDASGREVYNGKGLSGWNPDVSGRPFFTTQKSAPTTGPLIDPPDVIRDHPPVITMSRPLVSTSGRFLGIVYARVDPGYFADFYGTTDIGLSGAAALISLDGTILAFGSDDPFAENLIGRPISDFHDYHSSLTSLTLPVADLPLEIVVATPPASQRPSFRLYLDADFLTGIALNIFAALMGRVLMREARARERAESRLMDAIAAIPDGVALWDAEDRLVLANSRYGDLFGADRHFVHARAEFEALARIMAARWGIPPQLAESWIEEHTSRHRHAHAESIEKVDNDGEQNWFLLRERRTGEGGVVSIFIDITGLRRNEEALRVAVMAERDARKKAEAAMMVRSQFLANVSHELRTPLNSIIGFSEIIARETFGPGNPRYAEYASLIEQSGRRLLSMINDILDLAKMQGGQIDLKIEPIQLAAAIAGARDGIAGKAAERGVSLSVDIDAAAPVVLADPYRLRQVLANLLSNAVRFSHPGGAVHIAARSEGRFGLIEIMDKGIGMAPEDIPKALEPFSQLDGSLDRTHEGAGIGLSLSKTLVEHQGGRFEIESAPNQGTTIRFTLPAAQGLPT